MPAPGSTEPTLREARSRYFEANGFGADGGYSKKFDVIKLGWVPMLIPNPPARVAALQYHLHHVVTGYGTDWRGEFEIACFELAAGCGRLWFAWAINLAGAGGALLLPSRAIRAWARGRHSRGLYRRVCDDALLERTVGDVRRELGLEGEVEPTLRDRIAFAATALLGLVFGAVVYVGPPALIVGLAVWWIRS